MDITHIVVLLIIAETIMTTTATMIITMIFIEDLLVEKDITIDQLSKRRPSILIHILIDINRNIIPTKENNHG